MIGNRSSSGAPVLELRGIRKAFGETVANDGIDLRVNAGEIHAILGENGAGKSTLMKIIYGVLAPDAGTILWQGQQVDMRNPAHARELGISMVFQHFSLFETLTVAENISLAMEGTPAALAPRIREIGARFGLPVDPDAMVHTLSVGQKQRVEIIRCLLLEPRLIIMDEPTSVLPPTAVPALFDTVRALAAQGCAVLFISHKMEEIRNLCHTATVIRGGRYVATTDPARESAESLAKLMIGRDIPRAEHLPARPAASTALEVSGLNLASDDPFATSLRDINLAVRPGEIVGIAGVSGNGQAELATLLSGEMTLPRAESGATSILGTPCAHLDARARRALGLAFVPEERNGRGAVPDLSLEDNALLTGHPLGLVRRGLVRRGLVRDMARKCIDEMRVECSGPDAMARSLSGGNLQKFIMGREMHLQPKLMIAAQPTWGVDVGASADIRRKLIEMRDAGAAILVISEELEELFEISDQLFVMFRGQLSPSLDPRIADLATVGAYMTGGFLERADIPRSEEIA